MYSDRLGIAGKEDREEEKTMKQLHEQLFEEIRKANDSLNDAADRANAIISELEERLATTGATLEVNGPLLCGDAEASVSLGFGKLGDRCRILAITRLVNGTENSVALLDSPRHIRILGAYRISELVWEIHREHELLLASVRDAIQFLNGISR